MQLLRIVAQQGHYEENIYADNKSNTRGILPGLGWGNEQTQQKELGASPETV